MASPTKESKTKRRRKKAKRKEQRYRRERKHVRDAEKKGLVIF